VVAPPEFTEDAHFYCAACGQDLGTWGSFKREAKQYPPRRARAGSPAN
jgi:hypothetical protein